MINNFTVKANSNRNELSVKMDGFFMKSELELALYLVKNEIKKLTPGFTLAIDIKNLYYAKIKNSFDKNRVNNLARSMGAGKIWHTKINTPTICNSVENVGFYPYENEWLFQ